MTLKGKFQWTVLSDDFIKNYMPNANGTYVKVYIYWEMMNKAGDYSIDLKKTASDLNLSIEDVEMAKSYWEKSGLLSEDLKETGEIEYSDNSNIEQKPDITINIPEEKLDADVDFLIQANQIPEFKKMFQNVDMILQRETGPNEKMKLVSMMTDYSMNPDVITEAFKVSIKEGKRDFFYAEGIIRNWFNAGVTSIEKLNEYLEKTEKEDENYKEIRKIMGRFTLVEEERKMIDKWVNDYDFDMSIIREGMKRLTQTNNPNFNYLDKIFTDWHKLGIKTVQDIELKDNKKPKPKSNSDKNSFNSFEQRENEDNEDFDYHNQQKIEKMLKEEEN